MVRFSKIATKFLLLLCSAQGAFAAMEISQNNDPKVATFRAGQLLVKTHAESNGDLVNRTAGELGATVNRTFTIVPGLTLFDLEASVDIDAAVEQFMATGEVEYAEPNYIYSALAQNDPRFPSQWALENTGQTGGTPDADINANLMWQIEDGNQNVVVGVIDSGVDYNHSDLRVNMWRNVSEIAGNGIDDDGNGYRDDIYGINAILNNGNPFDDNSHGTHVAGTIGADGNNLIGIVGVAQDVQIAACKFLGANGSGAISDAIQCMQYFAALKSRSSNPVNIVATNNSWGGGGFSSSMRDAIRAHQNLGILFVAAAGNASQNNDVTSAYPANYDLANVIAVAATDHSDRLASFSNYGRTTVHVGAPGVRILSTVPNQGYATYSGTSMATPHVVGLIAVIKSRFPTYDYRQIKNLVLSAGTSISALQGNTITGRRIRGADNNGRGSLTCSNQIALSRLQPRSSSASVTLGSQIFLSALHLNCNLPGGDLVLYTDANETVVLRDTGLNGDALAGDGIYSLLWRPQRSGTYLLNFGNGDTVTVSVSGSTPAPRYQASQIAYGYETIAGNSLNAGDETIHAVSVPFPIRFNGDPVGYQTAYVSPNGTISFTTTFNPGYVNTSLPTTRASTLVAPFWDDLIPSGTNSNIFVSVTGTAPNRRFVVEWRNLRHYNIAGYTTFQAIFYEANSDIRFNYFDTNFGSSSYNSGQSATVGVQTSTTSATLYSYNAPNVPSQRSLLFRLQ